MAEYTRMRNNVLGYPIYGLPYVICFSLLDADGDPVTGLTCDSEISKNGNTAVDCHNEGVEIAFDTATNKGMYYLDLTGAHTGTEMVADVVAVTIYTGVAADKATCMVLYPKKLPKILTGTVGATGNDTTHVHIPDGVAINDFYNGCIIHMNESGNDEVRMIIDYVASTKLATLNSALDAAPTASTSTYDVYMTEVAIASIIALWIGAIPNAVAGAANGLFIAGTNAAVTVTGATTLTGNVALGNGLTVSAPSTADRPGVSITGNGTGQGVLVTGGGTSASGVAVVGGAPNGIGIYAVGDGSGEAARLDGGDGDGSAVEIVGGATNGAGVTISGTGTGHGVSVTSGTGATGNAVNIAAASTNGFGVSTTGIGSGDGMIATGGLTGSGIKGTGGGTSGHGIYAKAAGTGHGISANGGGVAGDGLHAEADNDGDGIEGVGAGAGNFDLNTLETTDAIPELLQATPSATPTLRQAVMLPYMALRNKRETTATLTKITNDAATVIAKATLSDNGTTFTKEEFESGP